MYLYYEWKSLPLSYQIWELENKVCTGVRFCSGVMEKCETKVICMNVYIL